MKLSTSFLYILKVFAKLSHLTKREDRETGPSFQERSNLSKGQAKISSMNKLNCVSDLMSDLIENTGYAALSIYILLLAPTASHLSSRQV